MKLPNSKYSEPRHTPGGEYFLNGNNYVGWYIVTYKDEVFTGKYLTKFSKKLISKEQLQQSTNIPLFVSSNVEPNTGDYANGYWTRYFVQQSTSFGIIEVNNNVYNSFKSTPGYLLGKVKWTLTGPAENITKGRYIYIGAIERNKIAVDKLNKKLKGINNYIKDYSEFVQ